MNRESILDKFEFYRAASPDFRRRLREAVARPRASRRLLRLRG